jgi:hypothetical protein
MVEGRSLLEPGVTISQFKAPQVSGRNFWMVPLPLFLSCPLLLTSSLAVLDLLLPQGNLFSYHLTPTPCPPAREEVEQKEGQGETVGMYETED